MIFQLPKALQSKEISTEIANQLVDRLPIDFIVRMLNNRGKEKELIIILF